MFDETNDEYTNPQKTNDITRIVAPLKSVSRIKIYNNNLLPWGPGSPDLLRAKITVSHGVKFLHVFSASAECHLNYFLEKKSYDEQIRYLNKNPPTNIDHIKAAYGAVLNEPKYQNLATITEKIYNGFNFDTGIGIKATILDHNFIIDHMKGDILLDSWDKLSDDAKKTKNNDAIKEAIDNARAYMIEFKIPLIHEINMFPLPGPIVSRGHAKYLRQLSKQEYIFFKNNDYNIINILHKCSDVHLIQELCIKYQWTNDSFNGEYQFMGFNKSVDQLIPLPNKPIKIYRKFAKKSIPTPISVVGGSRSNKSNLYKLNKYISKNKQIESLLYNHK